MAVRPGAKRKVLNLIVLLDTSGSMAGSRIKIVNDAMRELKEDLDVFAEKNPLIDVKIRVITFSAQKAKYYLGSQTHGVALKDYKWNAISDEMCDGDTPMGEAVDMLYPMFDETAGRRKESLGEHISRPVILLISDGAENGNIATEDALAKLLETNAGAASFRVGLAIDYEDEEALNTLNTFGRSGCVKISSKNNGQLKQVIKAITTTTLRSASNPKNANDGGDFHKANRESLRRVMEQEYGQVVRTHGDILEL